jgi:hypothetical protein
VLFAAGGYGLIPDKENLNNASTLNNSESLVGIELASGKPMDWIRSRTTSYLRQL